MMEHITKLIYLASIWSCQLKPRINFSNCLKLLPHSSFFGSYFLPVCRARTWHAVRVHLCVSHWKEATLRCPISFWLKFQHTSAWYSTGAFCSNKTLKNKTRRMRNFCNLSLCENLSVTLPRCYAVFLSLSPGTPHKHMQNKRQDVGEKLIEINKKTERNLKKKKKKIYFFLLHFFPHLPLSHTCMCTPEADAEDHAKNKQPREFKSQKSCRNHSTQ